ncbi:MAG: N-acetylmuramoyl-L-alanine amidase [Bacteroidales bacterium]|nr:N-acetylmuramoyl-L-alanine amidase [Bacteroidales bacterium]
MLAIFLAISAFPLSAQSAGSGDLRLKTVVIDAGHGGKDAGAVSKDRKAYEKNITLAIALKFGRKIEDAYPDVKVIYTRTTDKFVELNERAAIANRNKADLFISVHINSTEKANAARGYSAHILGQSSQANRDLFAANMELSKRENSVILLEEDYDTKYQGFDPSDPESKIFFNLMQNAYYEQSILFAADVTESLAKGPFTKNRGISQNPFLVLWKTTMPAVLLELGFISSTDDLKIIGTSSGQDQIATRLFNAFKAFKTRYDGSLDYAGTSQTAASSGVRYGIQILTLSRRLNAGDSALKGYDAEVFVSGKFFKYVVETGESESDVKQKISSVRKNFPDAYLVKIENGVVYGL